MKYVKFVWLMVAVLFVTACVNTKVMTRSETLASHKLTTASVEWNKHAKVKYTVSAMIRGGGEMSGMDKLHGLGVMTSLLKELSQTVPLQLKKELAAAGVESGEAAIIQLTPVKTAHTLNAGRSAYVQLSILMGEDKSEAWTATVRVNASKGESNKILAEKMAQTMTKELRASGWI